MKKDKEKIKAENKQKEEYIKSIFNQFLIDAREKFGNFDLSNMDKNAEKIYFDVETKIQTPARYVSDYNAVILGQNLDDTYTEAEKQHAIYHELVHMTTTKKAGGFNPKTGFGFIAGQAIAKRVAITEGMTEYMTERITGNEIDIAYLFEKRCAKSLCVIFGDDIIQDFLNADEKSLYNRAEEYGIAKKEMKELFNNMDKSILWRNNSIINLRKGNQIKKKNKYVSDIEQKLINIAARVSLSRGMSKEEVIQNIDKVSQNFIQPNLKFDINDVNEENFLSEYCESIDEAFEYSKKAKEDILTDKITSASQLTTSNNNFKDKIKTLFKLKKDSANIALPSSMSEKTVDNMAKEVFLSELENLKNTDDIVVENIKEKEQKEISQVEKTI